MKEIYPTVKIIHDRRKIDSTSKPATVEIEVSFQGKRKWISTGVRVLKRNWNDKFKVVGLPDALDYNLKIESIERTIQNHIRKLMIDGTPFEWRGLEIALENSKNENSFLRFVEERVKTRKDIKESTRRNQRKLVGALKEFKDIDGFRDLVKSNIVKFDDWLRGRKDYKQSTIASYHRYLKTYINEARRMELINTNPYDGFKVDHGKPAARKYLTPEELVKVETCDISNLSISRVRDMFIFQCYTGLAYSDMKKFDFHLVEMRGQRYVLHDIRKKTEQDYYIVLLPPALEILRKYDFELPKISNEQYNMRLKLVADYAGLTKNLTSHMGRHTFATMSLNSGIKIEVLAQMMGHADIRTTQLYAKMINCTVEEAYGVLETNEMVKSMINQLNEVIESFVFLLKSCCE